MKDVNLLVPELITLQKAHQEECRKNGITYIVTQTERSRAEQTAIYNQGRSTPGRIVTYCQYPMSPHCWCCAYDIAITVNGKVTWDRDDLYRKAGAIGKALGLQWGGEFKRIYDTPHYEIPKYVKNKSVDWLLHTYGTPEKFKAAWPKGPSGILAGAVPVKVQLYGTLAEGKLVDGVTYAPVRVLAESLNKKVEWDAATKTAFVNGEAVKGVLFGDTSYAPVRTVAELFGLPVSWDASNKVAKIGE